MPQSQSTIAIETKVAASPETTAHALWARTRIVDINREERCTQELDLVARLLKDEPAAWRFFTQEYSRVALACIRKVLSRFTRVTSEYDIDEVYARYCFELLRNDRKKLKCFDPNKGSRLSTWIGMLASNASYDYLRGLKRDRLCDPMPETDTIATDTQSPFEALSTKERAAKTAAVIAELSDRDREFVQLYYGQGLEPEIVAELMNISIKTVYTKRHKIAARLESILAEQTSGAHNESSPIAATTKQTIALG